MASPCETPTEEGEEKPVMAFRKRTAKRNVRKREVDEEKAEDDEEGTAVRKRTHETKSNPLFVKSRVRESKGDRLDMAFQSRRLITPANDTKATAGLETETLRDRDAQAIYERGLKMGEEVPNVEGGKKLYRGQTGYAQYVKKSEEFDLGATRGPTRAPLNIRVSARFDYQPDLCKDYKETGFCGFGDACKFLHDRGDYKTGWQLEREWEEAEKRKQHALMLGEDPEGEEKEKEEEEEEYPWACFICRQSFTNPVVTRCKHYFCEKCALDHARKSTRCFCCNETTNGLFHRATALIEWLERHKDHIRRKQEESVEEARGDDDQEEEEYDDDQETYLYEEPA